MTADALRPGFVLVGVIEGAFGVRGEARVRSFTMPPENLFAYGPLRGADGAVALTPQAWRAIGEAFAVAAPEIASREDAMARRGQTLHAPRAAFAAPEDDEFYVVDLVGCVAENSAGAKLGEVAAIHDFGAGDLLEIRPATGPALFVPFTREVVPAIDLAKRRLVVDPPSPDDAD